nr:TPA_asm: coat protein [Solanum nigrum ilarvirus 1]
MSSSKGNGQCQCFDDLDAAVNNCRRCNGRKTNSQKPSNRDIRNQRRTAAYRQKLAAANTPLPVPVVQVCRPNESKSPFKLPGNQVWVTRKAEDWGVKTAETNDAIALTTIFRKFPEITPETKIYRLLFGFVAESAGFYGVVNGVSGDTVPDPPIVGRVGFKKHSYRCRDVDLGGKTTEQLADKAIVWCLDENRKAAKRVTLADFWVAISRPAPLMPPEDFLVEGDQ